MFGQNEAPNKHLPMIAGNWKMNKTTVEAVTLAQQISYQSDKAWEGVDVVLCPPYVDLKSVRNVLEFDHSSIELGAQDVYWESEGAYTGAISVSMLREVGCSYCIVGHSERRQVFNESDDEVNNKVKALFAGGIIPIVCCGESLDVREAGETLKFVEGQVRAAFEGLASEQVARSVIAYEPIWAIGTGRAATPDQAQETCEHIRSVVRDIAGDEAESMVRVLYGGSMNQGNAEMFLEQPDIDGGLVGGASLDAKSFGSIVETALKLK